MVKKILLGVAMSSIITIATFGSAFAASNPNGTGQPSASCEDEASAPNGFATGGFSNAQGHYAGSDGTSSQQNANSSHAVSQYDVACYQVSSK